MSESTKHAAETYGVDAAADAGTLETSDAPRPPRIPVEDIERHILESQVIEMLRSVFDPEIPVNIYELGMIYKVDVTPPGAVNVQMTLTSPMCPVAGTLPGEVQAKIQSIPTVTSAKVELVWEPPWGPTMMSEAAKLQLGMM